MEVNRTTIGRWLENVQMHIPDQPSPKPKPDPELDRLRKELYDRDEFERRMETEAEERIAELKVLHKAELDAVKSAKEIDKGVIDKLVAEKTSQKLAELEQERQKLDGKRTEAQEKFQALEKQYYERKKALEEQAATRFLSLNLGGSLSISFYSMTRIKKRKEP